MKQSVRFFAIGLMTSAILMFGYFAIFDKSAAVENIPVEELIAQIEEDDYRVISEEDFISFSLMNKDEVEANAKDKADAKSSDNKEAKKEDEKTDDKKDKEKKSDDKKDNDKSKEKSDKDKKKDRDTSEDSDKPKKVTFTTKPGIVTEDIAEILYDKKVIDDKRKFEKFLEDNGYSAYIQIGKFEVTTDMTYQEIADVITTYPGSN